MTSNDNSVFLTGASGFVGTRLLQSLVEEGYATTALKHQSEISSELEPNILEGDITDFQTIPSLESVDTLIHIAGSVSVSQSLEHPSSVFEINAQGTKNVLERARLDGVDTVLYLSSASVYGHPDSLPITESEPVQAIHPYAASKLAGERIVESYSNAFELDATTIRAFTIYGPGQASDNLVPIVIQKARNNEDQIQLGNIHPTRDFVYVDDIVDAILTLLFESPSGYEVYNAGSENEVSVQKMAETIIEELNSEVDIVSQDTGRKSNIEIERMVADCTKLRSLGWQPSYDINSGVRKMIEASI